MKTIAFNHTMRTAGSTISNLLKELDEHNLIKYVKCGHIPSIKCDEILSNVGDHIRLSSVREPYDNTVSLFIRLQGTSYQHLSTARASSDNIKEIIYAFRDCIRNDIPAYLNDNKSRSPIINDILRVGEILFKCDGKQAHDRYLRFEQLNIDIDDMLIHLNILEPAKKLHMYEIIHRKFRDYIPVDLSEWYDDECRELVYKLRAHEFTMFGYEQ